MDGYGIIRVLAVNDFEPDGSYLGYKNMKLVGIILVIVGTLILLVNTGVLSAVNWGIIFPVILVALGINMFMKDGCNKMCLMGRWGKGMCGSNKEMECEGGKCEEGKCDGEECKK